MKIKIMKNLSYKTLFCKKTKQFVSIKNKKIEFVDVPVLYLKYKKFEIDNLSHEDKLYLSNNITIKHYKLTYERDIIYDRKVKKSQVTLNTLKIIKENINRPPIDVYNEFFKDTRTYNSVKALISRCKKLYYDI